MKRLTLNYGRKIFALYLTNNGYKESTIGTKTAFLKVFLTFLKEKGITDLKDAGRGIIRDYLEYLRLYRTKRKNRPLLRSTKNAMVTTVKLFFKSLYVNNLILTNPTRDFSLKLTDQSKPKEILTKGVMAELLDSIQNIRDRAVFELMYSSGLRISEVSKLVIEDIDFEGKLIHIRQSKFNKDRIVPVTDTAVVFLKKYLETRRVKKGALFLGRYGALSKATISKKFRYYLREKNLYKEGLSAHSVRHSLATHLLEAGVNLRYVQELLGHESIETTGKYTHMMYENLKAVYKSFHPRENEFFTDPGGDYLKNIHDFKKELETQREVRDRKREIKKRWYLNHKKKDI